MTVTETKNRSMKGTVEKASMAKGGPDEELLELNLPMVSLQVHRPHMHVPHMDTSWAERMMRTGRAAIPPPEQLVYYGGLGVLAVLGAVEWPIAAAIGVGTMIASRAAGGAKMAKPMAKPAAKPAPPAKTPARPTARAKAATRRVRKTA
ncbi:hypothetical protein [Acrocarpospora macrocephala]|uniref:Uncharacterized protein n=1 Tax=Acrocarpospora macrocephala TaxID=150177 RepID=A0A5M3WIL7_9ACTN|nr:hypothetical protein [Acrocarpospora macrocephala]GES09005.1 hypothetical protein Amac_026010 [Acrocarpospora macrocephala]